MVRDLIGWYISSNNSKLIDLDPTKISAVKRGFIDKIKESDAVKYAQRTETDD